MSNFEELLSKLLEAAPELSRSVIEDRIAEKKDKIGSGYLTDQGALFLVASDLGISLEQSQRIEIELKDLFVGAKEVTVESRILNMSPTKQFTNISLSVESGDLLSSKEYLVAGGDRKYVDETLLDIDIDDPPVPSRDLKIQNYSWANSAKHTIGNINVEISNGSRFKYDSVEIVLDFKTPRGATLISRKVRIDDHIDPYKEKFDKMQGA